MANSVDPDQTAPYEQFDQGLHCLHSALDELLFAVFPHLKFRKSNSN